MSGESRSARASLLWASLFLRPQSRPRQAWVAVSSSARRERRERTLERQLRLYVLVLLVFLLRSLQILFGIQRGTSYRREGLHKNRDS